MPDRAEEPPQHHGAERHDERGEEVESGHRELTRASERHHLVDRRGERGETTQKTGDKQQISGIVHCLVER